LVTLRQVEYRFVPSYPNSIQRLPTFSAAESVIRAVLPGFNVNVPDDKFIAPAKLIAWLDVCNVKLPSIPVMGPFNVNAEVLVSLIVKFPTGTMVALLIDVKVLGKASVEVRPAVPVIVPDKVSVPVPLKVLKGFKVPADRVFVLLAPLTTTVFGIV